MERIEDFLRGFSACIAAAKMYPVTHPQFSKVSDVAYSHLRYILDEKGELIIGLVEDEIVCENQVLFKISKIMELLITHARKKAIEKFYFYSDVRKEDFVHLISFLLSPEEISGDVDEQLQLAGVEHIKVSRLTTPDGGQKKKRVEGLSPYENALQDLLEFYEKLGAQNPDIAGIHQDLKLIVLTVRDKLAGKYADFLSQQLSKEYSPDVVRALNIGILSVTVVSKIGFSSEEVMASGVASLLYHAGQGSNGAGVPSRQNFLRSAKMLLRHKEHFGALPVVVAFERSQREATGMHTVSAIILVCEGYENIMTQPGGREQTPERIRQLLAKDRAAGVAPKLIERFCKIMGI